MGNNHQPVLLKEVIHYLNIQRNGIYVDATYGRGGHTREILSRLGEDGFLLAIDKDPEAVRFARESCKGSRNFVIKHGPFSMLSTWIVELGLVEKVNGILLDLGVSSPQLDDFSRGFSFLHDGPLDMRMDPSAPLSAADWINDASVKEIEKVLFDYGQERYARRIAKAIDNERQLEPIVRTQRLAEIIKKANPSWERHKHPATRSFQAIRIFINQELEELNSCLQTSLSVLAVGGRLAVISFHSLEDQIVKRFIQKNQQGDNFPRNLPIPGHYLSKRLRRIAWGVKAGDAEVCENPRSRSAVLRVAEKLK